MTQNKMSSHALFEWLVQEGKGLLLLERKSSFLVNPDKCYRRRRKAPTNFLSLRSVCLMPPNVLENLLFQRKDQQFSQPRTRGGFIFQQHFRSQRFRLLIEDAHKNLFRKRWHRKGLDILLFFCQKVIDMPHPPVMADSTNPRCLKEGIWLS